MTTEVKILKIEETNENANPAKANNGGGYSHPRITFEYKGIQGVYHDTSCGDFGTRYSLEWNGKADAWGTMLDVSECFEGINIADSVEILRAIEKDVYGAESVKKKAYDKYDEVSDLDELLDSDEWKAMETLPVGQKISLKYRLEDELI
ncbi:hypothetical protein PCV68_000984 [Staphylococcus pseudintermedius]|nr:hypothetical protein [Staphylococcus pseudintermedius]